MPLLHGQDIAAGEIEREISAWDAVRYARLCNAVAWASAWEASQALPAFTERVNVADNGIDAQWEGTLALEMLNASPFLVPGVNIFQYKKREVTEQTRAAVVTTMCADLRGAASAVERRSGHAVASYVLFTNIDLTTEQHDRLHDAIADRLDHQVNVGVVGAADLSAMVNELPHIRSAFFATSAFRTWGESWDMHTRAIVFPHVALTGREEALATLRGWIDHPDVRVIALSGAHMMGKTRMALEATRYRDAGFVEALDRQALNIDQLRRLEAPGRSIVVLINDPDVKLVQRIAEEALARIGLKLILSLSAADAAPSPSFGLDKRVQELSLPPLIHNQAEQLLRAVRTDLDLSLESWVIDNAGGVPGVILAAAYVGRELRRDGGSFFDQVADGFEREVRRRLSEKDQRALGVLSIMSHTGIEREAAIEVETISSHFGLDLNSVLNAIDALKAAGFVRIDGSYAEVAPPPLANRLAARMIRGRGRIVVGLFSALSPRARRRFLLRLVRLQGHEAQSFWDELLGEGGALASLKGVAENSELFEFAATAKGTNAGPLLLRLLEGSSIEQRKAIAGHARRDLVHAAEEMLFREATGESALQILALLAEAENERWTNNASGVFEEAIYPLHSQMPLPLPRRLDVLRVLLAPGRSVILARLAIKAAANTLESHFSATVRHSSAASPLGQRPAMTWGDVWRYQADCLDLLFTASAEARVAVRRAAAAVLPRALANFVSQGHYQQGMPLLRAVVDRVVSGDTDLIATELAGSITWCRHALRDEAHGGPEQNAGVIEDLSALLRRLQSSDYETRMRLHVGGWSLDIDNIESPTAASEQAISALAQETCASPDLLTDERVTWLRSAAQGNRFWQELGRHDTNGAFHSRIRSLGIHDEDAPAFICYIMGWRHRDPQASGAFFEQAAAEDLTSPRAVLFGALEVDAPDTGADRIAQLLKRGTLAPERIEPTLVGRWAREVSEEALLRVLEPVAGTDMEGAPQIPELLFFRLHNRALDVGPLAAFAWRYLEANSILGRHLGDYYRDQLGARLALLDPDRAFGLLDRLIREERSGERWNPLTSRPALEFWKALSGFDRPRAVATILEVARSGTSARWSIAWHLPNLIELSSDAALLVDYAARGEAEALAVCQAITGGRPGFWEVAFRLIDLYPASGCLKRDLELRVEQIGQVIAGSYSAHFRRCLDEVERARQIPGASAQVCAWLEDFSRRLGVEYQERCRIEADERINRS